MHEYPLTQKIINTAAEYAKGARVASIALVMGEMCGAAEESLRMYFDIIAEGTVCADAKLVVETIKPLLKCTACGALFARRPFTFACECGGEGRPTDIGREFYIKHIEVEEV